MPEPAHLAHAPATDLPCEYRVKTIPAVANRLVTHIDAALEQLVLYIPQL